MNDKQNLNYEELENDNSYRKIEKNNYSNENTKLIKDNNNFLDPEKGIGHTYTFDNSKLNSQNKKKYGHLKCWYLNSNNGEPSIVLGPHCKNH